MSSSSVQVGRSGNSEPVFRLTSASLTTRPSTHLSTMDNRTGNESTLEESDKDEPQIPKLEPQVEAGGSRKNEVVAKKEEQGSSKQKSTGTSKSQQASGTVLEYEVEEILEKRKNKKSRKTEYFVKWLNWPSEDNTWEPPENLSSVQEMVDEFEEKNYPKSGNKKRPRSSPAAKKKETIDSEPARKSQKTSSAASASASASGRKNLRSAASSFLVEKDLHDSLIGGDEGQRRTRNRAATVVNAGRYAELSDDEVDEPPKKAPAKKPLQKPTATAVKDDVPAPSDEDDSESFVIKPKSNIVKIKIGPKSKMEAKKRLLKEKELQEKEATLLAEAKTREEKTEMPSTSQTWKKFADTDAPKQDSQQVPTGVATATATATTNDDQSSEKSFHSAASTSKSPAKGSTAPKPQPDNATNLVQEVLYAREQGDTWQYLVELEDFSRTYVNADIILQDYPKLGLVFWEKWMKRKNQKLPEHPDTFKN